MWQLINNTPFAAERAFLRDRNGAEVWVVTVKGTYEIRDDGSVGLASQQVPVCVSPEYWGDPELSSLKYESDIVLKKQGTDILLHGHAYSPDNGLASSVDVTLEVGSFSKSIRVYGDRKWLNGELGMRMTSPEAFEKMPLVYNRSYGGKDERSASPDHHDWERRNPIGSGFAIHRRNLVGLDLPNLENPKDLIRSASHRPSPTGFGPIAPTWSPRIERAGTYDEHWEAHRQPLVPDDFDDTYYRCAPDDQQMDSFLKGGEMVSMHNLDPSGLLQFKLPVVQLECETHINNRRLFHGADLFTVMFEPDERRVIMVWQSSLPCHHTLYTLRHTVLRVKEIVDVSDRGAGL